MTVKDIVDVSIGWDTLRVRECCVEEGRTIWEGRADTLDDAEVLARRVYSIYGEDAGKMCVVVCPK